VLGTTDRLGRVTRYSYDASGNVTAITDPLNHTRTLTNDPVFNQVTSLPDPLGHVSTFTYDDHGNLIALTDPLGNTTTRSYDALSRLIAQPDPLGRHAGRWQKGQLATSLPYGGANPSAGEPEVRWNPDAGRGVAVVSLGRARAAPASPQGDPFPCGSRCGR